MDHRRSKRIDVQLNVLLYDCGVPVALGKTRNISSGGAFVETRFRPGKESLPVDVEFVASNEKETGHYQATGKVVYSTRDGIGLMFDDFDPENKLPTQMLSGRRKGLDEKPSLRVEPRGSGGGPAGKKPT